MSSSARGISGIARQSGGGDLLACEKKAAMFEAIAISEQVVSYDGGDKM